MAGRGRAAAADRAEAWAERCPKPLVLFFDEFDSLIGPSLVSVLRQLRAGYNARPAASPYSVVLCGMRDPSRMVGPSTFNIRIQSLRLGDLTAEQVAEL